MSTFKRWLVAVGVVGVSVAGFAVWSANAPPHPGRPSLGRPASGDDIARMDLTVMADGAGLPEGSGTVAQGAAIYATKCQACHGEAGSGDPADRLTGGVGSLGSSAPVKTVASYWPYAPPVFDYIRRAMPLDAPQSLTNDEAYALVAYLLSIDGVVPPDARLDAKSLAKVVMPNRNGFTSLEPVGFDGNIERRADPQ